MRKTVLVALVVLLLASCSTTAVKDSAYNVGVKTAEGFLSTKEITDFVKENGRKPVVVIGSVYCSESVDYSPLIRGFQQAVISADNADLIIGSSERDEIREERMEQLQWSNMNLAKSLANELATDYYGRVYIESTKGGFSVWADFIEVESGKVVWASKGTSLVSLEFKEAATDSVNKDTDPTSVASTSTETTKAATASSEKSSIEKKDDVDVIIVEKKTIESSPDKSVNYNQMISITGGDNIRISKSADPEREYILEFNSLPINGLSFSMPVNEDGEVVNCGMPMIYGTQLHRVYYLGQINEDIEFHVLREDISDGAFLLRDITDEDLSYISFITVPPEGGVFSVGIGEGWHTFVTDLSDFMIEGEKYYAKLTYTNQKTGENPKADLSTYVFGRDQYIGTYEPDKYHVIGRFTERVYFYQVYVRAKENITATFEFSKSADIVSF